LTRIIYRIIYLVAGKLISLDFWQSNTSQSHALRRQDSGLQPKVEKRSNKEQKSSRDYTAA